jgi:hypothetical protein
MMHAVVGALLLGAVSTLGDFVWEAMHLRHRVGYGIVHGAIVCLCVGAVVGWHAGRPALGAAAGPFIGVAAAGFFYILAPMFRYNAMFPAWMFFWICFAILQSQLEGLRKTSIVRGIIAAALSGAAFYAISGIWTRPSPDGPNYLRHFLYWSFAFLPGFLALFAGRSRRQAAEVSRSAL